MAEKIIMLESKRRDRSRLAQALEQAASRSWARRAEGARILGESDAAEAVASLIELLRDEREEVRVVAAYSLAELRNVEGLGALVRAAVEGWLGYGIELTLVLTMVAEFDPALVRPLLDQQRHEMELAALRALINCGHREVAGWFRPFLEREEEDLRATVARGFGALKYGEGREYLRKLLEDRSWQVRTNAAWSLRQLRAEREWAGLAQGKRMRKI